MPLNGTAKRTEPMLTEPNDTHEHTRVTELKECIYVCVFTWECVMRGIINVAISIHLYKFHDVTVECNYFLQRKYIFFLCAWNLYVLLLSFFPGSYVYLLWTENIFGWKRRRRSKKSHNIKLKCSQSYYCYMLLPVFNSKAQRKIE